MINDSFQITQQVQTVVLRNGLLQTLKLQQCFPTLKITAAGSPGPRGVAGERGLPGLPGELNGSIDLPDFTLIFDNKLV